MRRRTIHTEGGRGARAVGRHHIVRSQLFSAFSLSLSSLLHRLCCHSIPVLHHALSSPNFSLCPLSTLHAHLGFCHPRPISIAVVPLRYDRSASPTADGLFLCVSFSARVLTALFTCNSLTLSTRVLLLPLLLLRLRRAISNSSLLSFRVLPSKVCRKQSFTRFIVLED